MTGYEPTLERLEKAARKIGRPFHINEVLKDVNTKEDGSMRRIGTLSATEAMKYGRANGIIVPVGKQNGRMLWRASE